VLTVRSGPTVGLVAVVALIATLDVAVGLSALGWVIGLICGGAVNMAVARGLAGSARDAMGPADLVTLARAVMACGVASLVAEAFVQPSPVVIVVALSAAALALDAVDGWVARHTRTASTFGARFDGEVDAFLILVLSVYVARSFGLWVLAIGAARYVFGLAGWGVPWQLPVRPWRRVVAASQGVVLTVAAAEVLPRPLTYVALMVAMALLAESFGRDVWWLWRLRRAERPGSPEPEEPVERVVGRRPRTVAAVADVLAVLLVWFALVFPNQALGLTAGDFLRIPVEGLLVTGLALVLPSRARRIMAIAAGTLLGLLTLVKALDVGFFAAFDRPFSLATDRGFLVPAVDFVTTGMGPAAAAAILVGAGALVVAVLVGLPLAFERTTRLVAEHRHRSVRVLTALGAVWALLALSGVQVGASAPIASVSASRVAIGHVKAFADGARDDQRFEAAAAVDRFRNTPQMKLLTGLRGKDVLLVFVESYGRSAVEDLALSSRVRAVLDAGTRRLQASGYSSRSAYLTSPTVGGMSWLAHATMQSGLWVDSDQRHDRLLSSSRLTLNWAFRRAGWQTYAVQPANKESWPEGQAFYHFNTMFDRRDILYNADQFAWSTMPDQYALEAFQRQVMARRDRPPVMAEVDLTSSHPPWAPVPRMIAWNRLGDGSVFEAMKGNVRSKTDLLRHPEDLPAAYVGSIAYSLRAVVEFVQRYGDDDLVLVVVGDHQPPAVVTGSGASHDVPVTLIARDSTVIDRIAAWGWHSGMRPDPTGPVWPMDAFRDRFLTAFSAETPPLQVSSALQRSQEAPAQ
jgi:phosphatidylglycerophosphate synthase